MYTVLLVDDYKPNLRFLEEIFAEAGFSYISADSVGQAEKHLGTQSFDLVLSDIQMPGANGFDLLSWIQNQTQLDIPVLLITSAMPEAEHRIRGLSLGAVDYVLRSVTAEELILRVRKAIESFRELKRLKASLEDSEKLASLGRIIAASNHEVKNLAHIVRMSAENIAKRNRSEADEEKMILLHAATMLADVTRATNGLLKGQDAPSIALDLRETVQQMVFMCKLLLKGILIENQLDSKSALWVKASPVALKQVILNLLLNARDAIEEANDEAGLITVSLEDRDERVCLVISDNGVGLPLRSTLREFPAFTSTKSLRGGTGLGLWLSARLLQGMGGELSLHSEGPGKGVSAAIALERGTAPGPKLDLSRFLLD